jgi:hypothetical protein
VLIYGYQVNRYVILLWITCETISQYPVRFSYTITRNPPNQDDSEAIAAVVTGENTVPIKPDDQLTRNALIEIPNGTSDS